MISLDSRTTILVELLQFSFRHFSQFLKRKSDRRRAADLARFF